jgi:hypothetical protein
MKAAITIEFDLHRLSDYEDMFVAQLWHVCQANPAPITDMAAGQYAEAVGREIVKRWLRATPVDLWTHQGGNGLAMRAAGVATVLPGAAS